MSFAARKSCQAKKTSTRKWVAQSVWITLLTWFAGPTPAAAQGMAAQHAIAYVTQADGGATKLIPSNERNQE